MNPVRREPARTAGAVGAVAALLAVLLVYGVVDEEQAAAWGALAAVLIPILQAEWTRRRVIPTETVREAGYDPACVVEQARDPEVSRNREGES